MRCTKVPTRPVRGPSAPVRDDEGLIVPDTSTFITGPQHALLMVATLIAVIVPLLGMVCAVLGTFVGGGVSSIFSTIFLVLLVVGVGALVLYQITSSWNTEGGYQRLLYLSGRQALLGFLGKVAQERGTLDGVVDTVQRLGFSVINPQKGPEGSITATVMTDGYSHRATILYGDQKPPFFAWRIGPDGLCGHFRTRTLSAHETMELLAQARALDGPG